MKFVHSLDQHGPVSVQNRMAGYIWCQNTQEPQNGLDLTFICSNGSVSAHKLVVQECSPIISTIINQDGLLEEEHTKILLPEIKVGLVRKCLQLIYTGLAFFNSDTELKESLKFCIEQLNMNFVVDKHTLDAAEQQQHQQQQHQQPPHQQVRQQGQVPITSRHSLIKKSPQHAVVNSTLEMIPHSTDEPSDPDLYASVPRSAGQDSKSSLKRDGEGNYDTKQN